MGHDACVFHGVQGPPGLFKADDWMCSGCGNMNWARRDRCNMCNTAKPGTVDTNREGLVSGRQRQWKGGGARGRSGAGREANILM